MSPEPPRADRPRVGIDVGGTHVRVGVVEGRALRWNRRIEAHLARRLDAQRPEEAATLLTDVLAEAVSEARGRAPDAESVGLGLAAFLDPGSGFVRWSPNLPGLVDVDVAGPLADRTGLPVVVENDALAAAYGEWALHPDRPANLVYVGLGTGVGGGVVLDGTPQRGDHGVAMEVGHVTVDPGGRPCGCGNHGCLEQYASATGVRLSFEEATGEHEEAHEIAVRAHDGDHAAATAFSRAGTALGIVVAHITKVLDVTDVVIGGGLSRSWDLMEAAFHRRLEHDLMPVLHGRIHVRASEARDEAGMVGAALLAAHARDPGA